MIGTETQVQRIASIKAAREAIGLSQNALAKRLRVHRTHLNKIESGERMPGRELMVKMADVLEITLDELVYLLEKTRAERERR